MSGTTISPTACFIDDAGIHAPAFADIQNYLIEQVQSIFGSDVYLGSDSQDGQLLGILAEAIYDTNSMAVAVYNSYSPATALGVGLSSVAKINGLTRALPTQSVVDVVLTGVAGTQIPQGSQVSDTNLNIWVLPAATIPAAGQITATATAQVPGAVTALAGTVTKIQSPIFGWQSVTNPQDATPGAPLESDPSLRIRQTTSTMLPSVTALDGMVGAVLAVSGVTRLQAYENDSSVTDQNGIPSHSIALIVEGGDATQIATVMALHKTPGAGTFGTTTVAVPDQYGINHNISFFRPTDVLITVVVHLTALNGYSSGIGQEITNAIVNYVNGLAIGDDVFLSRMIATAQAIPATDAATFNLTSMAIARDANTPAAADITIAFNEATIISSANVTIMVP